MTTVASSSASSLNEMTWVQFERLVGEGFRLQGYAITETGGVGVADGGIDVVLKKGNEKFFVQCKQWRAFKVGVTVVRELFGVMAARGAAGGFVVTSGTFTADAVAFAAGRNIVLVDGQKLHALIRQAQRSVGAAPSQKPVTPAAPASVPRCPKCQAGMMKREGRKGSPSSTPFWGCARYPACRGTRPIDAA